MKVTTSTSANARWAVIEASVLYEAGEIVPRCGTTLDVHVREGETVTIGGKPPSEWPTSRLVEVITQDGVTCYRLALWGGDRLRVQGGECHWEQTFDGSWSTSCGRVFELND